MTHSKSRSAPVTLGTHAPRSSSWTCRQPAATRSSISARKTSASAADRSKRFLTGPLSKCAMVDSCSGPAPTHALIGRCGDAGGDGVELGQPDRPALDRPADGDAARLVEREGVLALGPRARGVLELLVPEAADALEPVPEEGADPHRVVVEPHLPVGADVEAGVLLLADDRAHGVAEGLLVVQRLERLADVASVELLGEPRGARIGADHRGRQERQDVVHPGRLTPF